MPKKIYATNLFAVLLAIAAFALPAPVMSQDTDMCETPDGWTVTLMDGYPMESSECPDDSPWEYRYEVCKPGTSGGDCRANLLKRVNIAIPDCYPDDDIILEKAAGCMEPLRTFLIGAGDPITKFETGDQFVYAARLPYWGPKTHERSFCANTNSLDETSICLDKFRSWGLDCCKILGPGCAGEVSTATLSNTFGPDKFVFLKSNPSLKCPDMVYGCDKEDENGLLSDDRCIAEGDLIPGEDIAGIVDTDAEDTDEYRATMIEAEGECIVWAQIGTASTRCAIIGGKKYCR